MKHRTFMKFLISYLIILFIPVFMFSFIIYRYFIGYYTDAIMQENINTIQRIKNSLDMQLGYLYSNVMQMSKNTIYATSNLLENSSGFYDVCDNLSVTKLTNNFIYDIFYYNKSSNNIYTSNAVFSFNDFDHYYSNYENNNAAQFKNFLDIVGRPDAWLPQQNVFSNGTNKELITYIIPINWNSSFIYSMIIFQIDTTVIDKLIGNNLSTTDNFFIIDSKNVIYSSNRNISILSDQMNYSLHKIGNNNYIKTELDNKSVLISRTVSDTTGLSYISVVPLDIVLRHVNTLKNIFIIGILIILAVGLVVILLMMRYNYTPVHQLSTFAKNILPGSFYNADEVETTRNALISLSENNKTSIFTSRELKREKLLLKLLSGTFTDIESFNAKGGELGLQFSGPCFKVILFSFDVAGQTDGLNYFNIIKHIQAIMIPDFEAYALEYSENVSIILILSGDDKDMNILKNKLYLTGMLLKNDFCLRCIIGVGDTCNLVSNISKSYFEALTTIKYCSTESKDYDGNVYFYSEFAKGADSFTYPNDVLNSLYTAIQNCDAEKIDLLVNILIQELKILNSSSLISCICYDIINIAEKAIRDLNHPAFNFKVKYSEILFGMNSSSIGCIDLINKLLLEIIENIEFGNSKTVENNIDKILLYINAHYMESDFCVKGVSHQFGMSISNFSHYFKSRIGQNVSDYINSIRFEKAKKLLRDTDLPIQRIVNQVGYIQASSFMRKFKNIEGKTAGEYRDLFRFGGAID